MAEHLLGTDRAADERILGVLAARRLGFASGCIGEALGGVPPEYVRTLTNRIRDADIAESTGADRAYAKRFWGVA